MKLRIVQLGGMEGSFAGDAAIISCQKSEGPGDVAVFVVDLGHSTKPSRGALSQADAVEAVFGTVGPCNELFLVHTHQHADHSGGASDSKLASMLSKATYLHGVAAKELGPQKQLFSRGRDKVVNAAGGWTWKEELGDERIEVHVIGPDMAKVRDTNDENECSLGVAIAHYKGSGRAERCVASYLSLGDMAPSTADDVLEDFAKEGAGKAMLPFSAIKLSHHASDSNLMEKLWKVDGLFGPETQFVSSGFTGTPPDKLAGLIKNSQLVFLVRDQSFVEQWKSNLLSILTRSGIHVMFAVDFVLEVDGASKRMELLEKYYDSQEVSLAAAAMTLRGFKAELSDIIEERAILTECTPTPADGLNLVELLRALKNANANAKLTAVSARTVVRRFKSRSSTEAARKEKREEQLAARRGKQ